MIVNFTKMHALGNDFVMIDLITQGARLHKNQIAKLADRKFGVGCDQVILITTPTRPDADFFYKIFNADGQEVEQCGNGARCAAKFFKNIGLTNKSSLVADCLGGTLNLHIENDNLVTVDWPNNHTKVVNFSINYEGLPNEIHSISVGNPHGVCLVKDLKNIKLKEWGQKLSKENFFPQGANISFMQVIDRNRIQLRVFERGVGPTLACGSAACAAALIGKSLNLLDNNIIVEFQYGELQINIRDDGSLRVTGPAKAVFMGRFKI